MANVPASGIEPGQRRLNGPQSTGREYRNLSRPTHAMAQDDDVAVSGRTRRLSRAGGRLSLSTADSERYPQPNPTRADVSYDLQLFWQFPHCCKFLL